MKKTVIVTGARRGLGLAIVQRLASEGYRVIAVARGSGPELDALQDGENVVYEEFDLANLGEIHA